MNILRFNDHGAEVGLLQQRLVRAGYPVDVSHLYDETTERAVKALQAAAGLVDDGIAGPKTYAVLASGQRDPKHLTLADIIRAANTLGVSVACVRAVNEVESRGTGFLDDGRPKILFERHVMYQRLVVNLGKEAADAAAARWPGVVNPKRGGYQGGAAEYVRLDTAARIDAACAYESASWGAFQIMAYHWERLGYASVDDFVARMELSEAEHLDAFVRFVATDKKLLAALKGRKWAAFADGYNGPEYAINLYDVKLDRAYVKYAGAGKAAA
ncbi:N-acetylmuramidase domain-containing protein [Burkholderia pseudomallei]|uniref:N-acetylmuramidase domain-containing protein n=1 Tax=Burkholderia pseudomallei TaxID=28450 RepID=UPI0008FF089A|nr:N-acetylmuramidase family protein [Burkholderia pseudomallei]APD36796.1 peptidoglycan-binding protein [Burkholderia pseudomallei]ARK39709.1 peptidoglycan-binding protein [Burkholderia pseudomallei]ARL58889.1 peptidoglycan-binding protein [Burkholderia pseudomallei]ARL65305.1 peptidoglycan-binding protein [Burkholderia pseudomallei]